MHTREIFTISIEIARINQPRMAHEWKKANYIIEFGCFRIRRVNRSQQDWMHSFSMNEMWHTFREIDRTILCVPFLLKKINFQINQKVQNDNLELSKMQEDIQIIICYNKHSLKHTFRYGKTLYQEFYD